MNNLVVEVVFVILLHMPSSIEACGGDSLSYTLAASIPAYLEFTSPLYSAIFRRNTLRSLSLLGEICHHNGAAAEETGLRRLQVG